MYRVGDGDLFDIDFTKRGGDLEDYLGLVQELENDINKKFGYLNIDDDED